MRSQLQIERRKRTASPEKQEEKAICKIYNYSIFRQNAKQKKS